MSKSQIKRLETQRADIASHSEVELIKSLDSTIKDWKKFLPNDAIARAVDYIHARYRSKKGVQNANG